MGTQTYRSGHATYYLVVSLVSQNVAGNYSTLNIHLYAQADSGWSGNASGIGWSATGGSGTFSFNGSSIEIANYNINVGHDANGYCNYSISSHTNATGTSSFAGPTDMIDSGSLPRIPKPPKPAPVLTASITGPKQITVVANVPSGYDDGGVTTQSVDISYSKDGGAWSANVAGAWGNRVFSNLTPGSYQFRAVARNAYGSSPVSNTTSALRVVAGGKRAAAAGPMTNANAPDLTIMRRATAAGTGSWVDITSAKKATGPGSNTWVDLVGPDGTVSPL